MNLAMRNLSCQQMENCTCCAKISHKGCHVTKQGCVFISVVAVLHTLICIHNVALTVCKLVLVKQKKKTKKTKTEQRICSRSFMKLVAEVGPKVKHFHNCAPRPLSPKILSR